MQLVGDPWLIDLAAHSQTTKIFAASLLRCMVRTQRATGHYLDLGDATTRSRILLSAVWGRIPTTVVRCAYCGVEAELGAWFKADEEANRLGWPDQRAGVPRKADEAVRYREVCTGVELLKEMATVLAPSLNLAYLEQVEQQERDMRSKGE